jgi:hypothetical protein
MLRSLQKQAQTTRKNDLVLRSAAAVATTCPSQQHQQQKRCINSDSTSKTTTRDKDWIPNVSLDTRLVHEKISPCKATGAILTPLYLSTTFVQDSVETYLDKGYSYSRTNNPTVKVLEEKVASIENGFGAICVGTGS